VILFGATMRPVCSGFAQVAPGLPRVNDNHHVAGKTCVGFSVFLFY
jgi:hypothetical protein